MSEKRPISKPSKNIVIGGLAMYGLDSQIQRGIANYRNSHDPWHIIDFGHTWNDIKIRQYDEVKIHGVICNLQSEEDEERVKAYDAPYVNVSGNTKVITGPTLKLDVYATGKMAAEYFKQRGFRNFLYYRRFDPSNQQKYRLQGFLDQLKDADTVISTQGFGQFQWHKKNGEPHEAFQENLRHVVDWLPFLKYPIAIFAESDRMGAELAYILKDNGIHVPDQAAILGSDNIELACETAIPPLSSLALPGERLGYEAGAVLDQLMAGQSPVLPKPFEPLGIVERLSTSAVAIEDAKIAKAVAFMREYAKERINVTDIIQAVGMPKSSFERRFVKALGRSALDELYRIRIEIAKQRLLLTNDSIFTIALESGFRSSDSMTQYFHKYLDATPSEFRATHRESNNTTR